jgi:hypothetical protein
MPLGHEGSFIGAVAAGPGPEDFRSVLLTQEGFVLFDAWYRASRVEVLRAVPPLDAPGFGRGMTGDVRLLLFLPAGELVEVGTSARGERVCRWQDAAELVEVSLPGPRTARVLRYRHGRLEREVLLEEIDRRGFAHHARLNAKGIAGYSLSLELLNVEPALSR